MLPHTDPGRPGLWALLSTVPHRVLFSAGLVAASALALWWAWALTHPMPQGDTPALMIHGLLMPLGVFPLFMWGFLFTAGPRWLGVEGPTHLAGLALSYIAGVLLTMLGLSGALDLPVATALAPAGLSLMILSWAWVLWLWGGCLRRSRQTDTWHARILWGALCLGMVGTILALLWVLGRDARWWLAARQVLLWGFLLPVFLTVSHRMLPFFTQSALGAPPAWRPYPLLAAWLIGCALVALGQGLAWRWLETPVSLALAASLLHTSGRWGLRASLSNRLLAMLHLSFAWFGLGLLLNALGGLGLAVGSAPTHALALGGGFTMLMGFVTRVTLGHSGRALMADGLNWGLYLALHAVALARVLASIGPWPAGALSAIALVWVLVLLIWAARVLPIYLRPRTDGKAG